MKSLITIIVMSLSASFANAAKAPFVNFGSATAKYSYLPFNFKIVDWNIYKGGKDGFAKDFAYLSQNADIATFQESYETPELVRDIATANPELSWTMVRGFKYKGYFTGVATGSRVQAMAVDAYVTDVHEPILNSPKSMLLTVYPLANSMSALTVLNVHGINFVINSTYKKQVEQIVSILKSHNGPMLVVGDFNTWNSGRLKYLDQRLASLGLERLSLQDEKASSLDHAYVRGLAATDAKLDVKINSSDHKPMLLQLQPQQIEKKADALLAAASSL